MAPDQSDEGPKVSIVMSAFNEEHVIGKAIESLQNQTYKDWEMIVVDDRSTDRTADIIRQYAEKDPRIRLLRNSRNLRLASSLNKGIIQARASLIARADADDTNLPERLERQYQYMCANPEIDVLGSGAWLLDSKRERIQRIELPATHEDIEDIRFLQTHFFHPSVMIRKRFFEKVGLYDPSYIRAQDKELWLRGLKLHAKYANLPEALIEYATNDYIKSWKTIYLNTISLRGMASKHDVKFGTLLALFSGVLAVATKLKLRKPRSILKDNA